MWKILSKFKKHFSVNGKLFRSCKKNFTYVFVCMHICKYIYTYAYIGSVKVIGPHNFIGNGTNRMNGFLKWVWPFWRKFVTVELNFEVFDVLNILFNESLDFLLPSGCRTLSYSYSTMSACMLPSSLSEW